MSSHHPQKLPLFVIGLMSGTSADGIDAALVRTDGIFLERTDITISHPYRKKVAEAIHAARLSAEAFLSDTDSIAALARAISEDHAHAVKRICEMAPDISPDVIGFHGQTIYHNPQAGKTVQLGDGVALSQFTGLPVIYDFRAADIDAGGQGAPLAPIYHQMLLTQAGCKMPAAFINIGGVANLTYCDAKGDIEGYDIGPGNGLIDDLVRQHFNLAFDDKGRLAAQGHASMSIVNQALGHPFFSLFGPRSLDRNEFDDLFRLPEFTCMSAYDQIATATAFTVHAIDLAIRRLPVMPKILVLAGGGIHNDVMMGGLKDRLSGQSQLVTAEYIGAPSDMVEAELIAFLAARYIGRLPSSFPSTTGAHSPQLCGKMASLSNRKASLR